MSEAAAKPGSRIVNGNDLLVRELLRQGVDTGFFIMGGPMTHAETLCISKGIRMIDVRHEQAAALSAQAYARVTGKPGVCIACSGPGVINLASGVANAFVDGVPLIAIGGSSPVAQYKLQTFQEMDQLAIMRPITKWAERVYDVKRIPEYVAMAFAHAMSGKPGPVYLDLPGDILFHKVPEETTFSHRVRRVPAVHRPAASEDALAAVVAELSKAKQPVIVTGTGILWSGAAEALEAFVDKTGIPNYTTPQGRGVVAEDHRFAYPVARSTAIKQADLVLFVGTRLNYIFGFGQPPRVNPDARIVQVDIDPEELSRGTADVGVVGDARTVLQQLTAAVDGKISHASYAGWRETLADVNAKGSERQAPLLNDESEPIHPLRLCKEVTDFMDRDAILVVDGQEILNYGRQTIPTHTPGHRLNSGPFGMMGVGMPFGVGAKAAKPDKQVIVLHGDGSFGLHCMEIDTAVRHKLPIIVVISLNGGWTSDPEGKKAGSRLGYTRYDKMFEALGCHTEYVEKAGDIRPALERARQATKDGRTALVNVVTDAAADAQTISFAYYRT